MKKESVNGLSQKSAEDLIRWNIEKKILNEKPFFFTSDIDWTSEDVMREYFSKVNNLDIKPTLFVTRASEAISRNYEKGSYWAEYLEDKQSSDGLV